MLIAINPARQFAQARNSQRVSNVNAILNAVGQYIADNKGNLPPGIGVVAADIPKVLCEALVPTYMPALPTAPGSTFDGEGLVKAKCPELDVAGKDSKYEIVQDADSRIKVTSSNPELSAVIEVIR